MPLITESSAFSTVLTLRSVSFAISLSKFLIEEDPPVRKIPVSIISADNSGGVLSKRFLMDSVISSKNCLIASYMVSLETPRSEGRPVITFLP